MKYDYEKSKYCFSELQKAINQTGEKLRNNLGEQGIKEYLKEMDRLLRLPAPMKGYDNFLISLYDVS